MKMDDEYNDYDPFDPTPWKTRKKENDEYNNNQKRPKIFDPREIKQPQVERDNELTGNISLVEDINPHKDDPDYEMPILEELGINPSHILEKMFSILVVFKKIDRKVLAETDMAGPFFIFILFGIGLLMVHIIDKIFLIKQGKSHFGYLYGFVLSGCITIFILMNLMSEKVIMHVLNPVNRKK